MLETESEPQRFRDAPWLRAVSNGNLSQNLWVAKELEEGADRSVTQGEFLLAFGHFGGV